MAVFMQLLPAGFAGKTYRSTDGAVFAVAEGAGTVEAGGKKFPFAPHDVFVVPPWCPYCLNAARESVIFSYSDRAGQEALGFWRESLE
jgi:gentisate 1,2-dioxygenase